MKLFTKYNRINLIATIIIFLLASVTFYIAIRYILINQVDQDLKIEQHEIETYVHEHNLLPEPIPVKDQKITYSRATQVLNKRIFQTIAAFDSNDRKRNSCRTIQFSVVVNGNAYGVTVAKSLKGTDDLIASIVLISSITILAIMIVSVLINRILLKRLWKPFYETLDTIKKFKLDKKQALDFSSNGIEEFATMNETLKNATQQAQQDYMSLKEFTENASHEMQTPLAIIRSKLDLLIQDENLSEGQGKVVQSSYDAIEKLSRLNQSLLLLAKIENSQFAETIVINFKEKVEQKIEAFQELWQTQNISASSCLNAAAVAMNPELADILLNNLFINATRHNFKNGFIRITLNERQFTISNSSSQIKLNERSMFARFSRAGGDKAHHGLGLSIIKQICDASGFTIRYSFAEPQHFFTVAW